MQAFHRQGFALMLQAPAWEGASHAICHWNQLRPSAGGSPSGRGCSPWRLYQAAPSGGVCLVGAASCATGGLQARPDRTDAARPQRAEADYCIAHA